MTSYENTVEDRLEDLFRQQVLDGYLTVDDFDDDDVESCRRECVDQGLSDLSVLDVLELHNLCSESRERLTNEARDSVMEDLEVQRTQNEEAW